MADNAYQTSILFVQSPLRILLYEDVSRNRAQASYGIMSEETQKCLIKRVFEYADEGVTLAFQGGEPLCAGISFSTIAYIGGEVQREKLAGTIHHSNKWYPV